MYTKITTEVVHRFNLEIASAKTSAFDEVFQDFKHDDMILSLEWDNWSGYIVHAKTESAEQLVREIAAHIHTNFN